MATFWGKLSMATTAALNAFRRTWEDPQSVQDRGVFTARTAQYVYLWHWYNGTVFDELAEWATYKNKYGLYRQIRAIHNPVERLVDFYAGIIYPGVLSDDARRLPDGTPLAIPLAEDVNPQLKSAVGQLWQWSNWQVGKTLFCRYGAALGDVFVEVVDELDKGKVTFDILWPGYIADLELDGQGNVKSYAIEYTVNEATRNDNYVYRKEVDKGTIRTYKDGALFAYDDIDAEVENPYGFAPAVWVKHRDTGGDHGRPALRNASVSKLDEVNGLASHLLDQEHRLLEAPVLISGEGVRKLTLDAGKRDSTHNLVTPTKDRESLPVMTSGPGGTVTTIELPEGEIPAHIEMLLASVREDHPELTLYTQLREMSQVTAPGAERLIGDAAIPIFDARANYDQQSIKLFQMAVAIAGWRAQSGAWGRSLTQQQQAFLPFGLESYQRGELNVTIMPRPLLPETTMERLQRERMEQALGVEQGLFPPVQRQTETAEREIEQAV